MDMACIIKSSINGKMSLSFWIFLSIYFVQNRVFAKIFDR